MYPHFSKADSQTARGFTTDITVPEARHILVIEDNPADVRLVEEALRGLDPPASIFVVNNGDEALQFLLGRGRFAGAVRPALVFLDFHLPKTDPGEVLRFIKQRDDLRGIPVVVLTTSNADNLIREAYSLGANSYLVKPSDLDSFLHTIRGAAAYWLNFPGQDG